MYKCQRFVKSLCVALLPLGGIWAGGEIEPPTSPVVPIAQEQVQVEHIYVDRQSGLMWQDAPYRDLEAAAYRRNTNHAKAGGLAHAKKYCAQLEYASYDDWRLPTVDELHTLHNRNGRVFRYLADGDYWTSTPADAKRYYVIFPADAYRYKRYPKESNYIRCVRKIKTKEAQRAYRIVVPSYQADKN